VVAAYTLRPVLGVPVDSGPLKGVDALHAIVQMPPGIPVGTLAIGKAGATNAALLAAAILANKYPELTGKLEAYRKTQADKVRGAKVPPEA
jgi:5-(carboxyamino)imidazole ribonucleotide mutase